MKPRYRVDLSKQQALCDANYLRLRKLMPELEEREQWSFAVSTTTGSWQVSIEVEERARYTTTVRVSQQGGPLAGKVGPGDEQSGSLAWTFSPQLTVRLYHDARMAEVIAWQRHRYMRARYEYPNRQMYQCDEKAQFNRFLAEWLSHCLDQGYAIHDLETLGIA